jgi:hypothetical protein
MLSNSGRQKKAAPVFHKTKKLNFLWRTKSMEGRAPVVEQAFDTLSDAIIYAFRQEQTSLLSLDRICQVIQSPNLYLNTKKD